MTTILWFGFIILILALLALDLFLVNRKDHTIAPKEALYWTALWVVLALIFSIIVYYIYEYNLLGISLNSKTLYGKEAAIQFITGFIIEKSLSVDNIFVIAIIFSHFHVPLHLQHRVLFWGIVGAMLFRGILIAMGSILLTKFSWIVYVFGFLLLFTAVKLFLSRNKSIHFDENLIVKIISKIIPLSPDYDGKKFFTRLNNKLAATPLFISLIVVETADIVFAIDSIPAIFAITDDPFIVFTSNVFAILGMRSLYFALAYLLDKFVYIKTSLVFILAYVGIKIMLTHHYKIPTLISLGIILVIIGTGMLASVLSQRGRNKIGK